MLESRAVSPSKTLSETDCIVPSSTSDTSQELGSSPSAIVTLFRSSAVVAAGRARAGGADGRDRYAERNAQEPNLPDPVLAHAASSS